MSLFFCVPVGFADILRQLLIRANGATERFFRKMEILEIGEEKRNNAPTGIDDDDDDKHDNTDLVCEEEHEEDYDLCSGCDENYSSPQNVGKTALLWGVSWEFNSELRNK